MTETANPRPHTPESDPTPDLAAALSNVLVGYLLCAAAYRWPGADGLLVSDVLREYTALASARLVPGELTLCERHPDLSAQVVAFFFLAAVADGVPD